MLSLTARLLQFAGKSARQGSFSTASQNIRKAQVVCIEYEWLLSNRDLSNEIRNAFGPEGVGLLLVHGIPNYVEARARLLPLSRSFATLPEEIKNKYVNERIHFQFGWSHGKEMFNGKEDYSKGSYYNNPILDIKTKDEELKRKYASFCEDNIWPSEELPEFEPAFKNLGTLIIEVGKLVARQCDNYQKSVVGHQGFLERLISESKYPKARLLHYFPLQATEKGQDSVTQSTGDWCGWHNDHSSLTGLTAAMYLDEHGVKVPNPDPRAGLYVYSRRGEVLKIDIPEDCLAFQIGETSQIHSGGALIATPHKVESSQRVNNISRETFAVFMQPAWDQHVQAPPGTDPQNVIAYGKGQAPPNVPPLAQRWNPEKTKTFGEFSDATFQFYY